MVRYVYIDVLLGLSFIVNYLLIALTTRYLQIHVSLLRLLAFAGIGALYSTGYVVGQWNPVYGHLGQLLVAIVVLRVVLPHNDWRLRGKAAVTFILLSWVVAGAAFAIHHMQQPYFSAVRWWVPLVAVGAAVLPARLAWQALLTQRWEEKNCVQVTVVVGKKTAHLVALLDTGNQLCDPLTGLPVLVAEQTALEGVLEEQVNWQETELESLAKAENWHNRLHVIPYRSLGKEDGLLVGFRPDHLLVYGPGGMHSCQHVVVAVYQSRLSTSGGYQAIAPPALMRVA